MGARDLLETVAGLVAYLNTLLVALLDTDKAMSRSELHSGRLCGT